MVNDTYFDLVKRVKKHIQSEKSQFVREAKRELQVDKSPIGELMEFVILEAIKAGASDIHFEPLSFTVIQLRMRVSGELRIYLPQLPMDIYKNLVSKLKITCKLDIAENRQPQDGSFSTKLPGDSLADLDIRVSIMPVVYGECTVLRLLNNKAKFRDLAQLDLLERNQSELTRLCRKRQGGILISGPVNSGKTTTMYALLDVLEKTYMNIVSIEDPVEYCMDGVNQIQINEKIGFTFEKALQAVLRQDIDCLAVGEVRNAETAKMLISAGLMGHMVLATIHTSGAIKTIFRLLDLGIKPYQIVSAMTLIVSQKLVKRLCPYCKQAYKVEEDSWEGNFLNSRNAWQENRIMYKAKGCDACDGKGYLDRIAIQELLPLTPAISEAISQGKTELELEEIAIEQGMTTLWDYGLGRAEAGFIDLETLAKVF